MQLCMEHISLSQEKINLKEHLVKPMKISYPEAIQCLEDTLYFFEILVHTVSNWIIPETE
jgi:hypothetical protein